MSSPSPAPAVFPGLPAYAELHCRTNFSFQVGASMIDPNLPTDQQKGDPSQSQMTTVEQFRTKYVFLAPSDYDLSYVDVVQPLSAKLNLDGVDPSAAVEGFDHAMSFKKATGFAEVIPLDPGQSAPEG